MGLGPVWAPALEGELTDAGVPVSDSSWNPEGVTAWRRRTLAASDTLTIHTYRVVAMRLASFAPTVIQERAQGRPSRLTLDRWGLGLALRYTHDVAPLHPGRAGQRLVQTGLPQRADPPDIVRRQAQKLWLAGSSRSHIGQSCALGPAALARVLGPLPARLTTGMVSARFGWSADNVYQRIARETFPRPDGVDGHLRWWWATTVDHWEEAADLVQCPQCPARVQRVAAHSRVHQ